MPYNTPEKYKAYRSTPEYKERARKKANQWFLSHKEKAKEYARKWYHLKRVPIQKKARNELFELLGGKKCARCGFSDERALQFDHINGTGYKEVYNTKRVNRTRSLTFIRKYLADPQLAKKELQVLCANCNWIKRVEREEWHKHESSELK